MKFKFSLDDFMHRINPNNENALTYIYKIMGNKEVK
jgi:hypothetical protein